MDRTLSLETITLSTLPPKEQNMLKEAYINSFPPDERRDWELLCSPLPQTLTTLTLRRQGDLAGLLSIWEVDSFVYVEHFFLLEGMRSQGLGGQALRLLFDLHPDRAVILEAEPEGASPMAGRRLQFYSRMGFGILPIYYVQPPYRSDSSPVPLCLLSSLPFDAEESERIAGLLHQKVYAR